MVFSFLMLACLVPATASANEFTEGVGDYLGDRLHDFMDIFWLQGGAAATHKTGGFHLRATRFVQFGYLRFEGRKAGMEGRALVVMKEMKVQRGAPYFCDDTEIIQEPIKLKNAELSKRPVVRNGIYKGDDGREQEWSLGAEIALPPCSFDLDFGICPEQIFDFVIGVVGIDPLGDDDVLSGEDPNSWFKEACEKQKKCRKEKKREMETCPKRDKLCPKECPKKCPKSAETQ